MRALLPLLLSAVPGGLLAGAFSCPADFSGASNATWYPVSNFTACSLAQGDGMTTAIRTGLWDGSAHCGECLWVEGPDGAVRVRITDLCPDCAHDLDLSQQAFAAIANPQSSLAPVTWRRVACPESGNLAFRFQGSNPFFYKIQARNHTHGVAAMAYFDGSLYQPMTRTSDNHFMGTPNGLGGDVLLRITATTGQTLTQNLGHLLNDVDIPGSAQFLSCEDVIFRDGFE